MKYAIIGSGATGHIFDVLMSNGISLKDVEIYHYNEWDWKGHKDGVPVKGNYKLVPKDRIICFSCPDNKTREKYYNYFKDNGYKIATLIHKQAMVSPRAEIGEGTEILQGTVVVGSAKIGKCCFINNSTVISHDAKIGDFVNMSAGAIMAGRVTIGDRTLIGIGAILYTEITIGKDCQINCGVTVFGDVEDGKIVKTRI